MTRRLDITGIPDAVIYAELARRKPIPTLAAEVVTYRNLAKDAADRERALRNAYDALVEGHAEWRVLESAWRNLRSAIADGVEAHRKLGHAEAALADAKAEAASVEVRR